ncbi:MAG: PspC domain-containing protein [Acidobacteriota bacterium]
MAVYCTRCGNALPLSARFCSNCGAAVPVAHIAGKPLMRPREGRQIGGVCLALSRAYGWDIAAVRILAVVALLLSSGLVGVAYLAAWIGIPEEPPPAPGVYPPGV